MSTAVATRPKARSRRMSNEPPKALNGHSTDQATDAKVISSTIRSRIFSSLSITKEKVTITFVDRISPSEILAGEEGQEQNKPVENKYSVTSKYVPHLDFINATKKLARHITPICDLKDDPKEYKLKELKVKGSMEFRSARAIVSGTKETQSGKNFKGETPDIALFTTDDYTDSKDLLTAVNKVIDETMLYLEGKHLGETQLALFEKR